MKAVHKLSIVCATPCIVHAHTFLAEVYSLAEISDMTHLRAFKFMIGMGIQSICQIEDYRSKGWGWTMGAVGSLWEKAQDAVGEIIGDNEAQEEQEPERRP
eukprot:5201201-Amphidinium_carterae.1